MNKVGGEGERSHRGSQMCLLLEDWPQGTPSQSLQVSPIALKGVVILLHVLGLN